MERKKIKPMEGCPTGYRFHPSENDLLFHYLSKKVEGDSDAIPPFKPEIFDADSQESFCVFTRLKIIKSRVKRTAGSGIWSNGNKRTIVDSRGDTVGYNKLFTFKSLTGREKTKNGRWTMHEHSMKGQDLVMCAITNLEMAEKRGSEVTMFGLTEEHPLWDYPINVNNVTHHQMWNVPPMPMSMVSSTPIEPNNNHDSIGNKNYPMTHYERAFDESTTEVDMPPSSWTRAVDAPDDNHNNVDFYGLTLMAAARASTPAQPWTTGPELTLSDPYGV
ncbi:hypothetical protein ACJRO7_008966 [Eucalyptus globulus]|uniref:NAC domain-containing protein n=1 Tax=Eucalyptus globulus TaxID=34317 RepID=A0ABD3IT63_EUCGL